MINTFEHLKYWIWQTNVDCYSFWSSYSLSAYYIYFKKHRICYGFYIFQTILMVNKNLAIVNTMASGVLATQAWASAAMVSAMLSQYSSFSAQRVNCTMNIILAEASFYVKVASYIQLLLVACHSRCRPVGVHTNAQRYMSIPQL